MQQSGEADDFIGPHGADATRVVLEIVDLIHGYYSRFPQKIDSSAGVLGVRATLSINIDKISMLSIFWRDD